MRRLTPKEEEIMHILWRLGKGYVKNILAELPSPKPSYNTISTIVRILEKKGFIGHRAYGNTYEYFPLIEKEKYTRQYMRSIVRDYFGNSYHELVSFFARDENIDLEDLEQMLTKIREQRKNG